jgi:hypothetical protein
MSLLSPGENRGARGLLRRDPNRLVSLNVRDAASKVESPNWPLGWRCRQSQIWPLPGATTALSVAVSVVVLPQQKVFLGNGKKSTTLVSRYGAAHFGAVWSDKTAIIAAQDCVCSHSRSGSRWHCGRSPSIPTVASVDSQPIAHQPPKPDKEQSIIIFFARAEAAKQTTRPWRFFQSITVDLGRMSFWIRSAWTAATS